MVTDLIFCSAYVYAPSPVPPDFFSRFCLYYVRASLPL